MAGRLPWLFCVIAARRPAAWKNGLRAWPATLDRMLRPENDQEAAAEKHELECPAGTPGRHMIGKTQQKNADRNVRPENDQENDRENDQENATEKMNQTASKSNSSGGRLRAACTALCAAAVLVLFDQLTKQAAVRSLSAGGSIVLIPGVLKLTYIQNRGAAFGILQDARAFFFVITLAALAAIGCFYSRIPSRKRYLPLRVCLVFIASGAVGNFIDRMCLSYVRDFIYFCLIDFPVFNVADIYITCATFAAVLLTMLYYRREDDFAFLSRSR